MRAAADSVRELLGMDVACVTQFTGSDLRLQLARGDHETFGLREGLSVLNLTYCRPILEGRLPNLIRDTRAHPFTAAMPVTGAADIGSYASVPIQFMDGYLHGTLFVASHGARMSHGERELGYLEAIAKMIADQIQHRFEATAEDTRDLEWELRAATAEALAAALDARDNYTGQHSRAVLAGVPGVAATMGLEPDQVREVEHVALLHDVGKIAIPDEVLQKPGPLDEEEWKLMRQHPLHGERLVGTIAGLEHLAPAVRAEHERWDGMGYPDGLAGEEIPLASRIVFVCDAYHAMTSDRPYRKAISPEEAKQQVIDNIGTQFCPMAAGALLSVLNQGQAA